MKRSLSAIAVAAVVLFVSCASGLTPSRQIDDAALAQSVRDALHRDADLARLDLQVNAQNGAVRLTGIVNSAEQKERAGRIAAGVSGVASLENLLTVR